MGILCFPHYKKNLDTPGRGRIKKKFVFLLESTPKKKCLVTDAQLNFPAAGRVQFGLLSDEETESMSTVQIKDTTIYYRGLPNPYGINDSRMGTVDRRLLCGTCGRDVKECQGHVGHSELSYPMYHIGFFEVCFKTLRCVCFACSRVLLTNEEKANLNPEEDGKTRFNTVYSIVKGRKRCQHCQMTQPHSAIAVKRTVRLASRDGVGIGG